MVEEVPKEHLDYVSLIFRQIERVNSAGMYDNRAFVAGVEALVSLVRPLMDGEFKMALDMVREKREEFYKPKPFGYIPEEEKLAFEVSAARFLYDHVISLLDRKGILRERLGVSEFR
jgi:hypothetical protein